MTTVFERTTGGPAMHALVIGVGRYPYGGPGAGGLLGGLTTVTSPPASALAVAEWLMAGQVDDEVAPLASVELLVSDTVPPVVSTPDGPAAAEPPTFAAVKAAFARWYQRCDLDEGNVAFFFFSGHGCARGPQLLLLEDVGRFPLTPLDSAFRIDLTVDGMARCRARTQCYLVDACRAVPDELLDMAELGAGTLIQPYVHSGLRDAPLVLSTGPGDAAYGSAGGRTVFTEALLDALGGLAARQSTHGRWEVTTDRLGPDIARLMAWRDPGGQCAVPFRGGRGAPIRRLRGAPLVPFRLGCDPREALRAAELRLIAPFPDRVALHRAPKPEPWEDSAAADGYRMDALFAAGEYTDAAARLPVHPPYAEFDLPVREGGGGADR